jgi:hypothetical protein
MTKAITSVAALHHRAVALYGRFERAVYDAI